MNGFRVGDILTRSNGTEIKIIELTPNSLYDATVIIIAPGKKPFECTVGVETEVSFKNLIENGWYLKQPMTVRKTEDILNEWI